MEVAMPKVMRGKVLEEGRSLHLSRIRDQMMGSKGSANQQQRRYQLRGESDDECLGA